MLSKWERKKKGKEEANQMETKLSTKILLIDFFFLTISSLLRPSAAAYAAENGTRSLENGARLPENGARSLENGVILPESDARLPESGERWLESGSLAVVMEEVMGPEITRRFVAEKRYISVGALKRDQPACDGGARGEAYTKSSSCTPPPSNPYNRGCSKYYRCRE